MEAKPDPRFFVEDCDQISDDDPGKIEKQIEKATQRVVIKNRLNESNNLDQCASFINLQGADQYAEHAAPPG